MAFFGSPYINPLNPNNGGRTMSASDYLGLVGEDYDDIPQEQTQDPKIAQLEKIQEDNRRLQAEIQKSREESARMLGAVDAKFDFLAKNIRAVQPGQAQAQTQALGEQTIEDMWRQGVDTGEQPAQTPPQQQAPPVDPRHIVRDEISRVTQEYAQNQQEEARLAHKFKEEYGSVLNRAGTSEVLHEWNRLKALRPDIPNEKRYELLAAEMVRRHGSTPVGSSLPSGSANVHPEIQDEIQRQAMSEAERVRRKDIDTAKNVRKRQKEQNYRMASIT